MPTDKEGNVAGVVMGSDGTVARTNYARQYLMQGGAAAVKATKELKKITGLDSSATVEEVQYMDSKTFDKAWDFLIQLYDCVNPLHAQLTQELSQSDKYLHLQQCLENDIHFVRPVSCQKPFTHAVLDLEAFLPTCYDVVSHQLIKDGRTEVTKDPIQIAPLPIMLLDKTAEDTLTVATAAHGPFGVLIKHNQADKYRAPWKDSPARTLGESEFRAYLTHTKDPEMAVDMMDRANNPEVQKEIASQFVKSERPGAIKSLIDRSDKRFDYGNTRPLAIANNFFNCYGIALKYVPEKPFE